MMARIANPLTYLPSILLVMLIMLVPGNAKAETEGKDTFTIGVGKNDWFEYPTATPLKDDPDIYTKLSTNQSFGGVWWWAENFGRKTSLSCGAKYEPTLAAIYNAQPIENLVTKITINFASIDTDYLSYLRSIKVYVFDPSETEVPELIVTYGGTSPAITKYLDPIEIPDPQPGKIYRIEFDLEKTIHFNAQGKAEGTECWISLSSIKFTTIPRPRSKVPVMDYVLDDDGSVSSLTFVSEIGDLHLIADEYDLDGNFTNHVVSPPAPANGMARVPYEYADNWTNKVAVQDEAYPVNKPTTADRMVYIRAKSVDGTTHYPEYQTLLTSDGIVTGIDRIRTDNSSEDATDEYFDLHGRKIAQPTAPGIYIRRNQSRVEKVRIGTN